MQYHQSWVTYSVTACMFSKRFVENASVIFLYYSWQKAIIKISLGNYIYTCSAKECHMTGGFIIDCKTNIYIL